MQSSSFKFDVNKLRFKINFMVTPCISNIMVTPCISNIMVTPCINNIQHFNFQLMHSTLKNVELLEHFKISKIAPTYFGLQGNHHQGATIST